MASSAASGSYEPTSYFSPVFSHSSSRAQDHEDEEALSPRSESESATRPSPADSEGPDFEFLRWPVMHTPGGTPIKMGRLGRRQEYLWQDSCPLPGRRQSIQPAVLTALVPSDLPPPPAQQAQTAPLQPRAERDDAHPTSAHDPARTPVDSDPRSRSSTVSLPSNNELPEIFDASSESSQARRIVRGLPEMRILRSQINTARPSHLRRLQSEPLVSVTAVDKEGARRNLLTRPKPVATVSNPQVPRFKPHRKSRPPGSGHARFASAPEPPATDRTEPHVPGAHYQMLDSPHTSTEPEPSTPLDTPVFEAWNVTIPGKEVIEQQRSKGKRLHSVARVPGIDRPNSLRSISRDLLRFMGVPAKQDNDGIPLNYHDTKLPTPLTPPTAFFPPSVDDEDLRRKKMQRLRHWLSRISLNPTTNGDISTEPKTPPPDDTHRTLVAPTPTTTVPIKKPVRKHTSPDEIPGLRRIATPPMGSRSGKLHGFFFDFKPPETEEETRGGLSVSPPSPRGEDSLYTPGSAVTSATRRAEREWFRVRMDQIMAEDEDEDPVSFKYDVPEHLPGSPLCPLSPKHKSGGKGVCIYHGRRKTQTERQLVEAYL